MQGCAEMSLRQIYARCLIGTGSRGLKINNESSTFLSQLSDIKILMWQNFSLPRERNVLREYSSVLDDYNKIRTCLKTWCQGWGKICKTREIESGVYYLIRINENIWIDFCG